MIAIESCLIKVRMQKILAQANDYPQRDRTESEWYEGV